MPRSGASALALSASVACAKSGVAKNAPARAKVDAIVFNDVMKNSPIFRGVKQPELPVGSQLNDKQRLSTIYSMYFIFTDWLASTLPNVNAALLKLGGPNVIVGLRENPKPSFGIITDTSNLPFLFSS